MNAVTATTPRKMNGWNLRIHPGKRKIIFQTIIFSFYVNLPGCISPTSQNSEGKQITLERISEWTRFWIGWKVAFKTKHSPRKWLVRIESICTKKQQLQEPDIVKPSMCIVGQGLTPIAQESKTNQVNHLLVGGFNVVSTQFEKY